MGDTFCGNCGARMAEGQQFCTNCGQKKETVVENNVSEAIAQFNENLVQENKNKGIKKKLIIGISAAAAALVLLIVLITSLANKFDGTYVYVSGESDYTYTFREGSYWYETDDSQESGTYTISGKTVTLVKEGGSESSYTRKGSYLYGSKACYDEVFDWAASEQTLTKTASFKYDGDWVTYKCELTFYADGTYEFESKLGSGSIWVDVSEESGRYTAKSDRILLYPTGAACENTYLIVDGKVYDSVFKKQ